MTTFTEDSLLPISALQHLVFCERQWALVHVEQQWAENVLTAEGRLLHDRPHEVSEEMRDGVRICRSLRLRSLIWGLAGVADIVEFHPAPYPIEYKRGREKPDRCDEVQLCAQALCLEEMLETRVEAGALFYGQPRRRVEVDFDDELRGVTVAMIQRLHELDRLAKTPAAVFTTKCRSCSLESICLLKTTNGNRSARSYLDRAIVANLEGLGPKP